MATITDIERERVNGRKYVTYNLKALHPDIPDNIDPNYEWFKYWTNSINGGASRKDIFDQNMINHDINKCDPDKISFITIEKILREKSLANEESINYFKRLTTINDKDDRTCRLMIYAGGRINWEPLLNDIKSTRTKLGVSKILHTLTSQVRAAAIQGIISMIFNTAHSIGKDPENITNNDRQNEQLILNIYNKYLKGGQNNKPLNIPTDPSINFPEISNLLTIIKPIFTKKGLTNDEIYNELIYPCETILKDSTDINSSKRF